MTSELQIRQKQLTKENLETTTKDAHFVWAS